MSARIWSYSLAVMFALLALASLAFLAHPALADSANKSESQQLKMLKSSSNLLYLEMSDPTGREALRERAAKPRSGAARQPAADTDRRDPTCWEVVASPDAGADYNSLQAVSAVSPHDIWAVGSYCCTESGNGQNLIEHWDGCTWTIVPGLNVGDSDNFLSGVAALSKKNVWAVGAFFDGTRLATLIIHWDGNSWSQVPSPNPGEVNNYLLSVAARSPNDIWAVGAYRTYAGGPFVTLTEHWDGATWSVVPSPNPGPDRNLLLSVAALSRNNVWAVGAACATGDCLASVGRTLIEHWDGSSWQVVPSPNVGAGWNGLNAVSASRPNDVWAVGFDCIDVDCVDGDTLALRFDGNAWSVVPTDFPGSVNSTFWAVTARTANDVWIGGSYSSDNATWTNILTHWDGTSFTNISTTSPGSYDNNLRAFAALGRNDVWVVGDSADDVAYHTQVQHFDGRCK